LKLRLRVNESIAARTQNREERDRYDLAAWKEKRETVSERKTREDEASSHSVKKGKNKLMERIDKRGNSFSVKGGGPGSGSITKYH